MQITIDKDLLTEIIGIALVEFNSMEATKKVEYLLHLREKYGL